VSPEREDVQAWVIPPAGRPRPAGLFPGGPTKTVRLEGTVPQHAVVAVTVERAGGAKNGPTTKPIFSAQT